MKATRRTRREATALFRLCVVNGVLDETRIRKVMAEILATKPRGYLSTLTCFERLVKLDCAEHTATIESPVPVPTALQSKLQNGLEQLYGPGLQTSFVQNPALIAGLRVRVGSDVYDGSVRGRLAALEEKF